MNRFVRYNTAADSALEFIRQKIEPSVGIFPKEIWNCNCLGSSVQSVPANEWVKTAAAITWRWYLPSSPGHV